MKNDLTDFERNLLREVNKQNGKNYTYTNFMDWSDDIASMKKGLEKGEILYSALGFFVAIKP